jgi:hypothetical protein
MVVGRPSLLRDIRRAAHKSHKFQEISNFPCLRINQVAPQQALQTSQLNQVRQLNQVNQFNQDNQVNQVALPQALQVNQIGPWMGK